MGDPLSLPISVIVPTLNGCDLLADAIASAQTQTFPGDQYEIIVVDNGSSDGTRELIERLIQHSNRPIRYVYEPRLGLHYARHAGARAAKGELLVFTDDDATFHPGWLEAYAAAFSEHPEMAAAGGPVRPIWGAPPPKWLLEFMGAAKTFGILSLMELYQEFRLDSQGFFWGVNMAIQRQVLFDVGGFNPESFGKVWLGDGESGLNRKLWERRLLVGYVPDALVYHHIPPSRMTVGYFCHRMANEGACTEYAAFHEKHPGTAVLLLRMVRIGLSLLRLGLATPVRAVVRRDRFALLKARMELAYHLYRIRYVLRLCYDRQLRELVAKKNWLETDDETRSS